MKNRIAQLRREQKVSQERLAEKVGLTRQAISFYETGKREPKLETWQKLADFFGVSVPYLQGIDVDYYIVTSKTKSWIIKTINDAYFEQNQKLDVLDCSRLQIDVNAYLELSKTTEKPDISSKEENIEQFWYDNFSFLFEDKSLIYRTNHFMNSKRLSVIRYEKSILQEIIKALEKYINEKFGTDLGKYVLMQKKSIFSYLNSTFNLALVTSQSPKEIKEYFHQFEEQIKTFEEVILEDIQKTNIKELTSIHDLAAKLSHEFKTLYNTNEEFKHFYNSFRRPTSKLGVLRILKDYKEKHGEDTSLIEKYLDLVKNIRDNII